MKRELKGKSLPILELLSSYVFPSSSPVLILIVLSTVDMNITPSPLSP